MGFPEDILHKIQADFGERSQAAIELLQLGSSQAEHILSNRIIRCIIHLSNGSLQDLAHYIQTATEDPRDVMLWAEYENEPTENPKRIRDFNKTFEEQDINE